MNWLKKALFSLFFIMLISISPAYAAEMIGQIVWVKGEVTATSEDKKVRVLERRSPIYEKDEIKTTKESSGQIVFTDGGTLSLRNDTVFKVNEYHFDAKNPEKNEYVSSVVKGGFRTITGMISKTKPDSYRVVTPVATIGVRGTEYSIFYSTEQGLQAKLDQGAISVTNAEGTLNLDKSSNQLYGAVKTANEAPEPVSSPPEVFQTEPALVPAEAPSPTSETGSDASGVTGETTDSAKATDEATSQETTSEEATSETATEETKSDEAAGTGETEQSTSESTSQEDATAAPPSESPPSSGEGSSQTTTTDGASTDSSASGTESSTDDANKDATNTDDTTGEASTNSGTSSEPATNTTDPSTSSTSDTSQQSTSGTSSGTSTTTGTTTTPKQNIGTPPGGTKTVSGFCIG